MSKRDFRTAACIALTLLGLSKSASADLITTLDFSDNTAWSIAISTTASATDDDSGVQGGGSTLHADRAAGGSGILRTTAVMIGVISTVGYSDITLQFTQSDDSSSGNLEWSSISSTAGDGFQITSTDDILFNTSNANAGFEALLDAGQIWTPTNASTQGEDLTFAPSVDNNEIDNLVFLLQVDAAADALSISNVQIFGNPIVATVPEPSTAVLLSFGCGIVLVLRRRKRLNRNCGDSCGQRRA